MKRLSRRLKFALAAGTLAAICLGANVGDELRVNRVSLPIRSGKFAFDKVIATAVMGDAVKVTAVEGDWLKVQYSAPSGDPTRPTPPVEGYVMEDALTARVVTAGTSAGPNAATEVAAAGASRGLLDAGKYAAAKGLNPDPFYKMVTQSRESMNDKAFDQFTKDGHVGPYKPRPQTGPS